MPSIWKRSHRPKAETYQFPDAAELKPLNPVIAEPNFEEELPEEAEPAEEELAEGSSPLSYAEVQARQIVREAERQAAEIVEKAQQEAERQAVELYETAKKEGFEAGRTEGIAEGVAQALDENRRVRQQELDAMAEEVRQFLDGANAALDRQLDDNINELRDLAIAVAEKVISVSLKSSSEVIGRMIQTAVDKRKRREWVRIHIAECDARHLTKLSPALTAALSSLSSQVRIIPMADDEPGTCIIEMPDEIIDAGAATQLNNIRTMLADVPADGTIGQINFGGRSPDHVPPNDPSGVQRGDIQLNR